MKSMMAVVCVFMMDLAVADPLTDSDVNFADSIQKAVLHTGSRGGGRVASANALAVLSRTIPYGRT